MLIEAVPVAAAGAILSVAPASLVAGVAVSVLVPPLVVEVPILACTLAPERVQPPPDRITRTAKMHSKQLILAIGLVGGAYLLIAGILAL